MGEKSVLLEEEKAKLFRPRKPSLALRWHPGLQLSLPGSRAWVVGKLIFRDAHHSRVCVGGPSVIRVSST